MILVSIFVYAYINHDSALIFTCRFTFNINLPDCHSSFPLGSNASQHSLKICIAH